MLSWHINIKHSTTLRLNEPITKIYREISITLNFCRLAALRVSISKKQPKNLFLDTLLESMCTNLQVAIFFSLVKGETYTQTYTLANIRNPLKPASQKFDHKIAQKRNWVSFGPFGTKASVVASYSNWMKKCLNVFVLLPCIIIETLREKPVLFH